MSAPLAPRQRTPAFCDGLVRRPALVRRLADARGAALAVVVAPPGYGKSNLLSEWAEEDDRRFLWLGLDAQNSCDAGTIATSILNVFEDDGWAGPASSARRGATGALADLIRSLDPDGRSFVLVLDDAHVAAPRALREVVDVVLEELPRDSTVALASRSEPALPLGRLRAQRLLAEVRLQDLAMAPAEAAILLRHAGLDLDFESVQVLARRTEGWPAGLYLAAVSLRDQADVADALGRFGGDDHYLAEYFRDEVLSELPPDLVTFAIRTSVLEELNGPLCDAVLERSGSAATLSELAQANPLLRPLDPAHDRYRWHGLFRDGLRAQLRRAEPELERELHVRASEWHDSQGARDGAIAHAVAAHDRQRAGDLLWANLVTYVTQGRNEIVQRWLGSFKPEELASHAPLALSAAHSSLAAGSADQAQYWAVAAAAARASDCPAAEARSLAAGLAAIEATVARDGASAMEEAAGRGLELEPQGSAWHPVFLLLQGTARHLGGNLEAAKRPLEQGVVLSTGAAPSVTSQCLAQRAIIALEESDWDTAAELTDRAERVLEESELAADPLSALTFAASAAALAHDGRADEAKRALRQGTDLLELLGEFVPWYGAEVRILLGHASLWLADIVSARTLLAEASRMARRTPDAVIFAEWFDEAWAHMDTLAEASMSGPSSLTIAELRVLRFLPSHRSFREIAMQLGVSANTVKTQAHAVYRKLGAASRSEAVARASGAGLIGQ